MQPLADLRDWLIARSRDFSLRLGERRDGRATRSDGGPILGPFHFEARRAILAKVQAVEAEVGCEIVSKEELRLIRDIWDEDTLLRFTMNALSDAEARMPRTLVADED